jgi:hypothetical protein
VNLLPILRHRATWGIAVALGVLVACAWHGHNKYEQGVRDTRADALRDAVAARAVADSVADSLRTALTAARGRIDTVRVAVTRTEVRTRVAVTRLDDAIATADTTCEALAQAAADAATAWRDERDTLTALVTAQDRALMIAGDLQATEPARLADALRVALAEQRRTFRPPSRLRWLSVGAIIGTAVTLGVR